MVLNFCVGGTKMSSIVWPLNRHTLLS